MALNVSVPFTIHCNSHFIPLIQFFEPLQSGSPTKRPRLEQDETNSHSPDSLDTYSRQTKEQDSDPDDAMPGFHEEDEREDGLSHIDAYTFLEDPPNTGSSRPRPPVSAPARSSLKAASAESTVITSTKLQRRRASDAAQLHPAVGGVGSFNNTTFELLGCPICGTTLETDNQGLNSHIDFCLSRGAIRQAHAEASSPVKKGSATGWQWPQPKQEAPQKARNASKKRKPK